MAEKSAVVGIGNILVKDEGIGVRIAGILEEEKFHVDMIDYYDGGTAIFSLMSVLEDYEKIILIDAAEGRNEPGTVYLFDACELETSDRVKYSLHDMGINEELKLNELTTGKKQTVKIIGIEPFEIALGAELSDRMKQKFPAIIEKVKKALRTELKIK